MRRQDVVGPNRAEAAVVVRQPSARDRTTDRDHHRQSGEQRATLVAQRSGDGYTLDIHLQGERETVFFAV